MAEGKSKTGVVKKRASKREKKDWIAAYIFIAPVTLGLLVFYIWPFIQNIWFSFNEVNLMSQLFAVWQITRNYSMMAKY